MEIKKPFVEILRIEDNIQYGTFGVMRINGEAFCVTLELPYKDNQEDISCIPEGKYICKKITTEKREKVFIITKVHNRTGILIHAGNTIEDTEGCPLVAQYFGKLKGDRAVLNSGNTYREFMRKMELIDKFDLEIKKI